jgi:DNA topoisomerase-1
MKLVIAEKMLAGQGIARILSNGKAKKREVRGISIWKWKREGEDWVLIPLKGHVINIDFSQAYKNWKEIDLPELISAKIVEIQTAKDNIEVLQSYAKKASEAIIACDYDQEGELIGVEAFKLIKRVNPKVKIRRAVFSAITKEDITKAFENLTEINFQLAKAAQARREVDLIWGAVLTRFISLASKRLGDAFLSVGRVQSPTLALLVRRELERMRFKPRDYWVVEAVLRKGMQGLVASYSKPKVWNREKVEELLKKRLREAKVESVKKKVAKVNPPTPFNTTDLLREASNLGFTAPRAMLIAERLYQLGKISYPRTRNQVYPKTLDLRGILAKLSKSKLFGNYVKKLLEEKELVPTKGKVEDKAHPPIHPTQLATKKELSRPEWKLYELVVRRFLSTLSKASREENIKAIIDIQGEKFIARGLRILDPGWKKIYIYTKTKEAKLPPLEQGDALEFVKIRAERKQTTPPNRYGHGTIIKQMESLGLGTQATRTVILQKLMQRGYVSRGKTLVPNHVAFAVTKALEEHAEVITRPEMTAKLEKEMERIEKGEIEKERVVEESKELLKPIIEELMRKEKEIGRSIREALANSYVVGDCPLCGAKLRILRSRKSGKRFIGCSAFPKCKHGWPLPQKGLLRVSWDRCKACGIKKIILRTPKRRPFIFCPNLSCSSRTKA